MNITLLIGLVLGFGGVVAGYVLDEGVLSALLKPSAACIVFGGTFGIMLMGNPMSRLKKVPAAIKLVIKGKKQNFAELVDIVMDVSVVARRDGLLALETEAGKYENPILKKGLAYIADGISPERLKQNLYAESDAQLADYEEGAKVFEGMGGAAPTCGVLGTVMGMVSILRSMSGSVMDSLGGKIATAFIATMYGVGSANLLWLPIASTIKALAEEQENYNRILIEGLLSIQAGEYPSRIKEYLIAMCGPENSKGISTDNKAGDAGGK